MGWSQKKPKILANWLLQCFNLLLNWHELDVKALWMMSGNMAWLCTSSACNWQVHHTSSSVYIHGIWAIVCLGNSQGYVWLEWSWWGCRADKGVKGVHIGCTEILCHSSRFCSNVARFGLLNCSSESLVGLAVFFDLSDSILPSFIVLEAGNFCT